MRLFVLGSSSFIAKNFIEQTLKDKKIKKIFLFDKKNDKFFYNSLNNKNISFFKIDLFKNKIFKYLKKYKPTHIINFAAETHVDKSIIFPNSFYFNNTGIVINLLNDLNEYQKKNTPIKLLHISTDEVFGSLSKKENSFNEKSKYNPLNPYSASKASCDFIIKSHANTYNLKYLIIHLSNNFGPYQNLEKLIPFSLFNITKGKKIPIYGNGKNIRDWLYVKDTAKLLTKLIKSNLNGNICVGGDNEVQNIDIIKKIVSNYNQFNNLSLKYSNLIEFVKDRPGHDFRYSLSNNKLKKYFKWQPSYNFDNKIKDTVYWYLSNTNIIKSMNNISFSKWNDLNYKKR